MCPAEIYSIVVGLLVLALWYSEHIMEQRWLHITTSLMLTVEFVIVIFWREVACKIDTLNVSVIGQVDNNRELVSLLSTGPLASYCLLFYSLMILCCIQFMLIKLCWLIDWYEWCILRNGKEKRFLQVVLYWTAYTASVEELENDMIATRTIGNEVMLTGCLSVFLSVCLSVSIINFT